MKSLSTLFMVLLLSACTHLSTPLRGTGDLGVIIERADGSVLIVEHSNGTTLGRVTGLGDLSHASIVYSRDARYAYVFGRDGGLTKVDVLKQRIDKRVMQAGNSIGGAISQDGRWVAVSNYQPGGVNVFDAHTLERVAHIPAKTDDGRLSKVVGLADAPGNRFLFSLWDNGDIWHLTFNGPNDYHIKKFPKAGANPYDALISPDGRYYLAGLFGEDGLLKLDLWQQPPKVEKILQDYGRGNKKMPVYKMPHLEGWAVAGHNAYIPAIGRHQVIVVSTDDWTMQKRIEVAGQPVFVMAQPGGRYVWVNFAFPDNHQIQVIDTQTLAVVKTLNPGKGVLHMEFTPRGDHVWMSVRDENRVDRYRTSDMTLVDSRPALSPSGIFFTTRAHKVGL